MAVTVRVNRQAERRLGTLATQMQWHKTLAPMHLAHPDHESADKYAAEAVRQKNQMEYYKTIWERSRGRNHEALQRANKAEVDMNRALHFEAVSRAETDPKAYVTHSLVHVQVNAAHTGQSIDDAIRTEISRLLAHPNLSVAAVASAHPNKRLLSQDKLAVRSAVPLLREDVPEPVSDEDKPVDVDMADTSHDNPEPEAENDADLHHD